MCLSAIYWSRINKIYYANTREDARKIDFDDSSIYSEIQKNIILKKQYLLFDFETPHKVRKKGYYTLLLKLIRYKYKNKKLVIYTQSNNAASNKAIKKSGFKFVRKMYA